MNEISRAVWAVNPNLPLAAVRSLQEVYDRSMARTSFTLVMLALAGGMALLLGVAGIYGVMSYSVSQRTREIGIRVALGARNEEVVGMFVAHGARLAAVGIGFGLLVAAGLTRFMSTLLFDVKPGDPLTYLTRLCRAGRRGDARQLCAGPPCDVGGSGPGAARRVARLQKHLTEAAAADSLCRVMIFRRLLIAAALISVAAAPQPSGWQTLWNGKNLDGWTTWMQTSVAHF